jgi:hypothetical protein
MVCALHPREAPGGPSTRQPGASSPHRLNPLPVAFGGTDMKQRTVGGNERTKPGQSFPVAPWASRQRDACLLFLDRRGQCACFRLLGSRATCMCLS